MHFTLHTALPLCGLLSSEAGVPGVQKQLDAVCKELNMEDQSPGKAPARAAEVHAPRTFRVGNENHYTIGAF